MEQSGCTFREFEVRLRLFISARTRHAHDIDDILQECFLRFHSTCRDQVVTNPLGYLYRVAINIIIDRSRSRSPLTNSANVDDMHESCLAIEPSQEQGRRLADLEHAYHAALAELSPRCAEVFCLRRHNAMATPDVAEQLSITTRMVQKHMVTAMAHLRDRLRPFLFRDYEDAGDTGGGLNVPVKCQITSSSDAHA